MRTRHCHDAHAPIAPGERDGTVGRAAPPRLALSDHRPATDARTRQLADPPTTTTTTTTRPTA